MSFLRTHSLAWLFVIAAPVVSYLYLTELQIGHQAAIFSAIAITTLLLWMFSLLGDYIPALLALLALLLFGLAPETTVLSGFASSGFLLAFSIMGLGVVIVESGLTRRYTLILLKHLPTNTFTHQLSVFLTGVVFTPTVPTITGRAAIVGPVVSHISDGWNEETKKRSSTMLYTTGLDSIHYLAPWFLTAAPANLMIFALLPSQEQQTFHFMFWAFAASVTGLSLLIFYFIASAIFFRKAYKHVEISHQDVNRELAELGPLSSGEKTALYAIGLLALGIVTAPLHKIEIHYVAFGVICLLLYLGSLERKDFVGKIDWAFLALLASMIGILATMNHLGLDKAITNNLSWLSNYMRQDFELFVLMLSGVILLARLLIPLNQAILIFAAALIPVASSAGIAPWVVGFIILIIAETAFFAYQSPYIFMFRNITKSVSRDEHKIRLFHALLVVFKIAAIYISIPFWKSIGVL